MSTRQAELLWRRQTATHATWSSSAEFLTECWRHLTAWRPGMRAVGVAVDYCVVAHVGVAPHSASSVDSGLLFATSFGRVVSARRHAQSRQGALDVLGGEPNLLQRLDALRFCFFGRFRYPVIGSDDVIGVWVVDA